MIKRIKLLFCSDVMSVFKEGSNPLKIPNKTTNPIMDNKTLKRNNDSFINTLKNHLSILPYLIIL